jgi:hypothetical protein
MRKISILIFGLEERERKEEILKLWLGWSGV